MGYDLIAIMEDGDCCNIFSTGCSGMGMIKKIVRDTHNGDPFKDWAFGFTLERDQFEMTIDILHSTKLHDWYADWMESNMNGHDYYFQREGITDFASLPEHRKEFIREDKDYMCRSRLIPELAKVIQACLDDSKVDHVCFT